MAINPNIPLQVQTPQFSNTLATLVQNKRQDDMAMRQEKRQQQVANSQIQANNALAQQRRQPSEEQINQAMIGAAFKVRSAYNLAEEGQVELAAKELISAADRAAEIGAQDSPFTELAMGTARLLREDPEAAIKFMDDNFLPMMKFNEWIPEDEGSRDRQIVGRVRDGRVQSIQTDGQGNYFNMQNKPIELDENETIVESVSLQSANAADLSDSARDKLVESEISTKQFIATAGDVLNLVRQNEDVNTAVGNAASLVNGLRQEAEAIGRATGIFDESQLNFENYEFDGLGNLNARTKSLITSLAYSRARINDPGGRLSERDVQAAIREIGGNLSDPEAFSGVIIDVANRAARDFNIRHRTLLNEDFQGDLGLESLQAPSQQQDFGSSEGFADGTVITNDQGQELIARDGKWVPN